MAYPLTLALLRNASTKRRALVIARSRSSVLRKCNSTTPRAAARAEVFFRVRPTGNSTRKRAPVNASGVEIVRTGTHGTMTRAPVSATCKNAYADGALTASPAPALPADVPVVIPGTVAGAGRWCVKTPGAATNADNCIAAARKNNACTSERLTLACVHAASQSTLMTRLYPAGA